MHCYFFEMQQHAHKNKALHSFDVRIAIHIIIGMKFVIRFGYIAFAQCTVHFSMHKFSFSSHGVPLRLSSYLLPSINPHIAF